MQIIARKSTFDGCPTLLKQAGFAQSQPRVSIGNEYEVFAISAFKGILFVQIINDFKTISWLPAWLFHVSNPSLPNDWICNFFEGELTMAIGPEFVAANLSAYNSMAELDDDQVQRFRKRLEKLHPTE